jgi:hypothetical protein
MRTPSPSRSWRQLPDDIDDATPRPDCFARGAHPVPTLSYKEALVNELIEDGDDVGHLLNLPLRTHSRNVPTGRPAQGYLFVECWEWGDIHTRGGYNRFETGAAR